MSFALQHDRRSQADAAHSTPATPLTGLDARSPRVGNDVTQAPRGIPPYNSRRRSASANGVAPLWEGKRRDEAISRSFHDDGLRVKDIAVIYGLSACSVSRILRRDRAERHRMEVLSRGALAKREAQMAQMLEAYDAGFGLVEIGRQHGISDVSAHYCLNRLPGYRPRRGPIPHGRKVAIPSWLPERHHDRYQRIASGNGEEVAASCLSKMLAWEARR